MLRAAYVIALTGKKMQRDTANSAGGKASSHFLRSGNISNKNAAQHSNIPSTETVLYDSGSNALSICDTFST